MFGNNANMTGNYRSPTVVCSPDNNHEKHLFEKRKTFSSNRETNHLEQIGKFKWI